MIKKDNDQEKLISIKETVSGLQKAEDLSAIEKKVHEETDGCHLKTEQLMSPLLQNDSNQEEIHQQISQLGQLIAPLRGAVNSLGIQQIEMRI